MCIRDRDSSNSGDAATYIMDDTSDTVDAAVDGVEEIGGTQMIRAQEHRRDRQRQIYHQIRQNSGIPVSYTHLDVYKRQGQSARRCG